jgi:hypothetical protein
MQRTFPFSLSFSAHVSPGTGSRCSSSGYRVASPAGLALRLLLRLFSAFVSREEKVAKEGGDWSVRGEREGKPAPWRICDVSEREGENEKEREKKEQDGGTEGGRKHGGREGEREGQTNERGKRGGRGGEEEKKKAEDRSRRK